MKYQLRWRTKNHNKWVYADHHGDFKHMEMRLQNVTCYDFTSLVEITDDHENVLVSVNWKPWTTRDEYLALK